MLQQNNVFFIFKLNYYSTITVCIAKTKNERNIFKIYVKNNKKKENAIFLIKIINDNIQVFSYFL